MGSVTSGFPDTAAPAVSIEMVQSSVMIGSESDTNAGVSPTKSMFIYKFEKQHKYAVHPKRSSSPRQMNK